MVKFKFVLFICKLNKSNGINQRTLQNRARPIE